MDLWLSLIGATTGEIPIYVGLCSGDFTEAEILACILANPANPSDEVLSEEAERSVFPLGQFHWPGGTAQGGILGPSGHVVFDNPWTFTENGEFALWFYNQSGAPLTTGSVVNWLAKIYGVWLR